MDLILNAAAKVLPILLLIALGAGLRRLRFLHDTTVGDLRKLIVTFTLPAALFLAFSAVAIEPAYLIIAAAVFSACLAVLWLARSAGPRLGFASPYFPPLMTGFEAGMIGYAIFGAVYGADQIYKFGIVDLGQVLFVFFVLVPGLQRMGAGAQPFGKTLLGFVKTPVILAIAGGLLFQAAGLARFFASQPLLSGILEGLRLLGALTTPLVALTIGYELALRPGARRAPLLAAGTRLLLWVPLGLLFAWGVVGRWLGLDPVFQAAVMTMVLLPGPYVIPIFMRRGSESDASFAVNTLTFGTLATLVLYALVPLFFPPG